MKTQLFNTIRQLGKIRLIENILVKLTINEVYGSFLTKLPPNHYQYKTGTIRRVSRDGVSYELDISDIMDWYVYFGFKEVARVKLYSLVNKDDIIFDVGANIGTTTLNFSKLSGVKGKIYSFEPDPVNYKSAQKNIGLNNFSNILLTKKGLGNKKGVFKIYTIDPKNKGMNRVYENSENKSGKFTEIEITTIDDFVAEANIQKLDLIKIDVEGFELNVLKGASKTIDKFHPNLFVELDNKNLVDQGISAKELVEFLACNEYNIFHAETNKKITLELDFSDCHYDIVAKYKK